LPDDRFIHPRLGHSEKVYQLSWFERAVWQTYLLAADDFGVMRFSAVTIRDADDKISHEPERKVQSALEKLAAVGLVHRFDHQRRTYCYQRDWQDYQHVRHPRVTLHPLPPPDEIAKCSPKTRHLFTNHPTRRPQDDGIDPTGLREDSGNTSEIVPKDSGGNGSLARARGREEANGLRLTANGSRQTAAPLIGRQNPRRMNPGGVVPLLDTQFGEFVSRASPKYPDRDATYDAIIAWMGRVDEEVRSAGKTISADPFKWWDARFKADWPDESADLTTAAIVAAMEARRKS
jgi:hypothetical protein